MQLSTQHLPVPVGARKLSAKWAGPYIVEQKISEEAYRLRLPAAWRIHDVFHTSQLKGVAGNPQGEAAVVLDNGEEQSEVEKILACRLKRGHKEYLVKWKGYGDFENSWEPIGNLDRAKERVREFEQQHARRG